MAAVLAHLISRNCKPVLKRLDFPEPVVVHLISATNHHMQVVLFVAVEDVLPKVGLSPHLDIGVH